MSFLDSNLERNNHYLVAVSGGADSMALLDMLRRDGFNLIVAHINYKKRDSSDRDEAIVRNYCEKHNIMCYVDNPTQNNKGNFEQWARNARYEFFKKIYDKHNLKSLIVAHHRDDVIETYLMKIKRKCVGYDLTIPKSSHAFGMNIYRPCYELSKKQLRDYCLKNNVEFGDDETNFQPIYERNRVRLNELSSLNEDKLNSLFNKAIQENEKWNNKLKEVLSPYKDLETLNFSKLMNENLDSKILILYDYINSALKNEKISKKLSHRRILDIIAKLNSNPNVLVPLDKDVCLVREYDKVLIKTLSKESFVYTLEKYEELKTPFFEITNDGKKMEGIHVYESDYPLTIRPYNNQDFIKIKNGHKQVRRLFIDKKIPTDIREKLPIVVNCKQEILLIPSLYKEVERKSLQSNFFMIKYHKY